MPSGFRWRSNEEGNFETDLDVNNKNLDFSSFYSFNHINSSNKIQKKVAFVEDLDHNTD